MSHGGAQEAQDVEDLLLEQRDRFRFATDAAEVGYWFCNLPFDKLNWDRRVKEHFWLAPSTDVTIELFYERIHENDREKTRNAIDESIRSKRRYQIEYRTVAPDGRIKWIRAIGRTAYDDDGNPVYFDGVTLDISEQRLAEKALIESEKLAVVGRLASSIAHEINNPLESVTNLLYLAQGSDDLEEIQGYLNTAERELRRVAGITTETLRFHKQASVPTAVHARQLIYSVLSIYQGRIVNSQVAIEERLRGEEPVLCFEGEIRQVLSNLVGNALDAMSSRGGRLLLRTRAGTWWSHGPERGLHITVADTGCGVPRDLLDRLFEPFFTTKGMMGTGLGLWICKEIIERHRGKMRVRSSVNPAGRTGTVFRLFLPFEPAAR